MVIFSVDLSLFLLLYDTNFMNESNFDVKEHLKQNKTLTVQIRFNLHPTFYSVKRLVDPVRRREHFFGLSSH